MPTSRVTESMDAINDAQASNDLQKLGMFNPTPEPDSLLERIAGLHEYGVPTRVVDQLLQDGAELYRLNAAERGYEDTVAGHLDAIARTNVTTAIGVKGFARLARPLLRDIDAGGTAGVMARRSLATLCRENPKPLAAKSLANELKGSYGRLQAFLAAAEARA